VCHPDRYTVTKLRVFLLVMTLEERIRAYAGAESHLLSVTSRVVMGIGDVPVDVVRVCRDMSTVEPGQCDRSLEIVSSFVLTVRGPELHCSLVRYNTDILAVLAGADQLPRELVACDCLGWDALRYLVEVLLLRAWGVCTGVCNEQGYGKPLSSLSGVTYAAEQASHFDGQRWVFAEKCCVLGPKDKFVHARKVASAGQILCVKCVYVRDNQVKRLKLHEQQGTNGNMLKPDDHSNFRYLNSPEVSDRTGALNRERKWRKRLKRGVADLASEEQFEGFLENATEKQLEHFQTAMRLCDGQSEIIRDICKNGKQKQLEQTVQTHT